MKFLLSQKIFVGGEGLYILHRNDNIEVCRVNDITGLEGGIHNGTFVE